MPRRYSLAFYFALLLGLSLQAVALPTGGVNFTVDLATVIVYTALFGLTQRVLYFPRPLTLMMTWLLMSVAWGAFLWLNGALFDPPRFALHSARFLLYVGFAITLFTHIVNHPERLGNIEKAIVYVGIAQGLYGLYQFLALHLGLPFADLRTLARGSTFARDLGDLTIDRIYSSFREPSNFGEFLAVWLFLVFGIYRTRPGLKQVAFISMLLMGSALVLTLSRGAILAFIAGFLIFLAAEAMKGEWKMLLKATALISTVGVLWLFSGGGSYLLSTFSVEDGDQSVLTRWGVYSTFLNNMGDHWLLGHGLGQFEAMFYSLGGTIWGPQSNYIYLVSNCGVIGSVLLLCSFMWTLATGGFRDEKVVLVKIAVIVSVIHGASLVNLHMAATWFLFAYLSSLIAVDNRARYQRVPRVQQAWGIHGALR